MADYKRFFDELDRRTNSRLNCGEGTIYLEDNCLIAKSFEHINSGYPSYHQVNTSTKICFSEFGAHFVQNIDGWSEPHYTDVFENEHSNRIDRDYKSAVLKGACLTKTGIELCVNEEFLRELTRAGENPFSMSSKNPEIRLE